MIKRLLTTFAVLTIMTAFAMAQVPLTNSGKITNKGTILVGCTVGSSVDNTGGIIANDATGVIEFTKVDAVLANVTGTVTNDGTIKFDLGNPLFSNTTGTVTNNTNGIIQFDGPILATDGDVMTGFGTATTRIGGTVLYSGATGQVIQGATYYTNLTLNDAGAKTFTDDANYYVSAVYLGSTASGDGARTYGSSIFHYDGAATQEIFAENGTWDAGNVNNVNVYNDLELEGAVKTITGTTVKVATTFNNTADLTMASGSSLIFNEGITANAQGNITATDATIQMEFTTITDGTLTIAASKTVTMSGTSSIFKIDGGTVTVTGTLALDDGSIAMAENTFMVVDGAFTNSAATTVLAFDPTSTVTYDGGTGILETSGPHSFGNLVLKTNNVKVPVANIYVAGDFTLSDHDLAMGATNKLVMTNGDKAATIQDIFEVTGQMSRSMNPTDADAALTFNNSATTVAITSGTLDTLTLYVRAGDTGYGDYKAAEDIKRSIGFDYNVLETGWVATMTYGYKQSEVPGAGDGVLSTFSETLLRYREVLTPNPGGTSEKVATNIVIPTRTTSGASIWGKVTLLGIIPGDNVGSLAEVKAADKLFLRGTPTTFYTIADGRWSNPATWDEGMQPSSLDNTEILHTVHVGFAGGADGGSAPGWIDERPTDAGNYPLAQTILIKDVDGASLVFGDNPDASPQTHNSKYESWAMNANGVITNENTTSNTRITNLDLAELKIFIGISDPGTEHYQGLIIFDSGETGTRPISLSTQQLVNAGGEVMVGPNTILQICQ